MICNMATSKNISSEYVLPRKTATFFTIALLTGKLKWTIEKKKYFGTGCLNFNYTLIADSSL